MLKSIDKAKVFQAVLCCLLWSTAIPVLKVTYAEMSLSSGDTYERIILAGMRFMLASIILFFFYILKNRKFPKIQPRWFWIVAAFGVLNTTLQYMFFYTGVMNTVAVKAVLLDSLKPLLVVLLAHFLKTDDRITLRKVAGLALGFAGIIAANITEFAEGGFTFSMSFEGEGMLFLASLAYAVAIIYGKKIMEKVHYLTLNIYQFFAGSAFLLIIGFLGTKEYNLNFTPLSLILLFYSGLLSAIVFIIWYRLISRYAASSITIFLFLIPVFGSIISSIVFADESITVNVLISLIFLVAGIVLVNYEQVKNKETGNKAE